ncbi:MAG: alcohol dehydrogenase [Bdellovibrionales bacterium RIFOXYD1_FULL_53_11]|nr:MAG: alcohol dehydrogenase [Bdellovibrionales bacterium RIFOXYD1_FULL_53_11]
MEPFETALVGPKTAIRDIIKRIDESSLQIALVVDESRVLLGTITDGDIRRGILSGKTLEDTADRIMNKKPMVVLEGTPEDELLARMRSRQLRHMPIVDTGGRIVGLEIFEKLMNLSENDSWVVLMAGGLGKRLGNLTENCPKPLLTIGDKPILETIISNLKSHGFHNFYVSVNYKAEMIRDYLGNGDKWNVNIKYLQEDERLGTAGSLGLLPEKPKSPLLVMNADLLTTLDFNKLMHFHKKQNAKATMCLRDYNFQVPFGVVKLNRQSIVALDEKPTMNFFVNAGIYVVDPDVLDLIPKNEHFDMTTLFSKLIEMKSKASAFLIREYWIDIGRINDLEAAKDDYIKLFNSE